MDFARGASVVSSSSIDAVEKIDIIRDEIEILKATLAPHEITHSIEQV